jgi:uncharacterized protein with PQ loop repeat
MVPFVDVLGWVCIIVSNIVMIPQLLRIIAAKHARDVSLGTLVLGAFTQVLWGLYGYLQGDTAIWISSIIALIVSSTVLYTYWYYER